MINLLSIEWLKLKRLNTFKVILIVYAVLLPLIFASLALMPFYGSPGMNSSIYKFPDVYHYTTYISSFFNLMIGVIIVVFTCNEIKYKTQRQNLIDGLSKKEIILSKIYIVVSLSFVITFYAFLIAVLFGILNNSATELSEGIRYIGFYFIGTLGYFIFAYFLANLLKNPALTIVFYLLSTFLEGILGLFAKDYSQFFPLSTFSNLIPIPVLPDGFQYMMTEIERSGLGLFYVIVFVIVSYIVISKRDI